MVVATDGCMDVESSGAYVDKLYSPDHVSCLQAVTELKNLVIGSNKQKASVIQMGVLPRLLQILVNETSEVELLIETVITIGSLARGANDHIRAFIDAGTINILLTGLSHPHSKFVEACVRCLRTILLCPLAPVDVLYNDPVIVPRLITMAQDSSITTQECVMTILYCACKTKQHQNILCSHGIVEAISTLLSSSVYKVQIPSLKCLARLCFQNDTVSEIVVKTHCNAKSIPNILMNLMGRDRSTEMQLAAAKCMTYIFRAGAMSADDPGIVFKALPTLVRMCQKEVSPEERVEGAEALAYLTEVDTELQRIASISDHLIPTLSELVKYQTPHGMQNVPTVSNRDLTKQEKEVQVSQAMKQAAFKAFSSLAANDEEIRKKIIDSEGVMESIVSSLSDHTDSVRLAAVHCLHSLSRSVQQLRTTFQDHAVWHPLMKILHNASEDVLIVASSTLCNLLLEFSPSKEPILECGAIELLCGLTRREEPALRLNGVWALMNMAFQADQKIKFQILTSLGSDQIFHLLSDPDVKVLMKTLGLLRNLLSTKPHIDHIMGLHGKQVMEAIVVILEGEHSAEVKEQALCVLTNIADGDFAKNFIMSNEDVLKKLTTYMMHSNVELQIAATFCISNLIWKEEEGALDRQAKLEKFGIRQLLQTLITTSDTTLFDKVKTALQQFPTQGT